MRAGAVVRFGPERGWLLRPNLDWAKRAARPWRPLRKLSSIVAFPNHNSTSKRLDCHELRHPLSNAQAVSMLADMTRGAC